MALTNPLYNALPKLSNIQGFWRFEDDFTDESDNGYDLTETSGTIPFVSGKIGKAGDFEADDTEYLAIANASCPNLNITGDLFICAWVKPESIDTIMTVVSKWDTDRTQYLLRIQDAKVRMFISENTIDNSNATSTDTIGSGAWAWIAGSFQASDGYIRTYLNGAENGAGNDTAYAAIGSDTEDFMIGAYKTSNAAANYYDGLIDEVLIYNAIPSAAEIARIYAITSEAMYKKVGGGILNWWFFKDAWERHDKIFKPKILKPEFVM
jgi:hypothetical protein